MKTLRTAFGAIALGFALAVIVVIPKLIDREDRVTMWE